MARRPLPDPSVPVIDPKTGLITKDWFLYFQARESVGLSALPDVSLTALANGEVLIYDATDALWKNGLN